MADPQGSSWSDLILPFAVGAASLGGGFAAGRNPGSGDNPASVFLQVPQLQSLMDYRQGLAQHYKDNTAYQQAMAQRQAQAEQRQQEQFTFDRQYKEAEQARHTKELGFKEQEAARDRQMYDYTTQFMPGFGGGRQAAPSPQQAPAPSQLPTAQAGPTVFQPPSGPPPGMAPMGGQFKPPSINITAGKPTIKFEPTDTALAAQNADLLAQDAVKDIADPEQKQATYAKVRDQNLKVLSGIQSKDPSPFEQTNQTMQRTLTFAKEFTDQSKLYLQSQAAFDRVRASFSSDHTAASDIALTYAFSKMMDPETGVRDAERETLSAGQALLERARAFLPKLESGTTFTPAFRKQVFAMGEKMYLESLRRYHVTVERPYHAMAKKLQVDPSVLPDYKGQDAAYLQGKRPAWTNPLPPVLHPDEEMQPPVYDKDPVTGKVTRKQRG